MLLLYKFIDTELFNQTHLYKFMSIIFFTFLEPQRSGYTSYSCIKHVYLRMSTRCIQERAHQTTFEGGHWSISSQIKQKKNLAFYIRKSIHNCYNAMTTSPCESMNSHIKYTSKATTPNNTRWVQLLVNEFIILITTYQLIYVLSYVRVHLYIFMFCRHHYNQLFSAIDYWWNWWSHIIYWQLC